MALYNSILDVIGDTPLLYLPEEKTGLKNIKLYAKLEYLNPFGSLKDRTALGMMGPEVMNEALSGDKTFIEASSGNTIKAMQAIASIQGRSSVSVTNRIRIPEIRDILIAMGVEIVEVPGKSSCIDPSNPEDPLYIIGDMMAKNADKYIYVNQYYNESNPQIHYETTAEEIAADLPKVDYLFATLGTTGSSQGVAKKLKEKNSDLFTVGVAAAREDFVPGIRNENDLMDVGIFDRSYYDEIRYERSTDAIDGMLDLIRKYGVLAGPTSGLIYHAAVKYLKEIDASVSPDGTAVAVIVLCDRMEWYMSYLKERKPELFKLRPADDSIKNFFFEESDAATIDSETVDSWAEEKQPLIIDTRSNLAFRNGNIPGSINIVDTYLEEVIDGNDPFPKERPILLVCARGKASMKYAAYLKQRGYDAYNLKNGINAYLAHKRSTQT